MNLDIFKITDTNYITVELLNKIDTILTNIIKDIDTNDFINEKDVTRYFINEELEISNYYAFMNAEVNRNMFMIAFKSWDDENKKYIEYARIESPNIYTFAMFIQDNKVNTGIPSEHAIFICERDENNKITHRIKMDDSLINIRE